MTEPSQPQPRRRNQPRAKGTFDRRRPFTTLEAAHAGITRAELGGPDFQSLFRGIHVSAEVIVTDALRAAAPLAACVPTAWASHASAARLLGAPLPVLPGEHVSVTSASDRPKRAGVTGHVAPSTSRIVIRDGVRMSAPAQMFVELGEQLTLVDLVAVGDWLVSKKLVSLEKLRRFVATNRMRGSAAARAAVAFVRAGVDSVMETRLRMLIVPAGLPEPDVNRHIGGVDGEKGRRYDLSWSAIKVIVEYDGRHHVEIIAQWEADLERRESIDNDEWRQLVFVSKDLFRTPDRTLARIEKVLRAKRLAGMPRRLSDDWRPHFPVRGGYLRS